jgi:tRNA(Ser,Leu) C12 N-acetylase TAN1
MNFNEKNVRAFYRLLNHRFLTELRFLKRGHFPAFSIVKSEDEFVKKCKTWNGKRNVYAGLRERRKDLKRCANFGDIVGLQIVTLDIDPIREAETPSTDQELKNALEVAEFIRHWFSRKGYVPPIRAMTGNGVCLYFCTPYYEITDENRDEVTRALEKFEQNCRKKFKEILKEKNCQIDRMFDLPRIGKVIGTMSVKGENTKERPWRLSYFIDEPKRIEDKKFLQNLLKGKI